MELKEEKKGGVGESEGGRERGRREEHAEGERDLVKNGHPAREDSLRLRRTMRPCSGKDRSSFVGFERAVCVDPTKSRRLIARSLARTFSSDEYFERYEPRAAWTDLNSSDCAGPQR